MNRDDLILEFSELIPNVVKRYTYDNDEDLVSIGTIAVIEGVDKCLSNNIEDTELIKAHCLVRAKNAIIDELRKRKYREVEDLPENDERSIEDEELILFKIDAPRIFTQQEFKVYSLLSQGYAMDEIMEKLEISPNTYYSHTLSIKNKIKEYFKS